MSPLICKIARETSPDVSIVTIDGTNAVDVIRVIRASVGVLVAAYTSAALMVTLTAPDHGRGTLLLTIGDVASALSDIAVPLLAWFPHEYGRAALWMTWEGDLAV